MPAYTTSSCDFDLSFSGPESVEAYDQKASEVGRCLCDAVNNIILRSTLPQWQKKMADALETLTGVERTVDQAATDKAQSRAKEGTTVTPIKERATRFIARASASYLANAEDEESRKSRQLELNTLAQSTADSMEVDPSPATRSAAINKAYLAKADEILTRDEDAIEETVSKLIDKVGEFSLDRSDDGKPERDSLAMLVGAYIKSDI